MIAFNDRKDKDNLELNELELFINKQYKKKSEMPFAQNNVQDSDDSEWSQSSFEYGDEQGGEEQRSFQR